MKLYKPKTEKEYEWLMKYLESKGEHWQSGQKPTETEIGYFGEIVIGLDESGLFWLDDGEVRERYPGEKITEVEPLMKQTEIKRHIDKNTTIPSSIVEFTEDDEPIIRNSPTVSKKERVETPFDRLNKALPTAEEAVENLAQHTIGDVIQPNYRKITRHKELTEQLHETYKTKNSDYGDSFGKSHEKYGAIAGLVRISDKFNRIDEIILNDNQQVADETVKDTLIDMANYSLLLAMELEEEE